MKVIDRWFTPTSGAPTLNYKPTWTLLLECGHRRILNNSDTSAFNRAEVAKTSNCGLCEKPRTRRRPKDADTLATAAIKYGW